MKDSKNTVRYLGYRALADGSREFDFSMALPGADLKPIAVVASMSLFSGPDQISLQEGAGICYETLKLRLESGSKNTPPRIRLTSDDVAQHRKIPKRRGRRP